MPVENSTIFQIQSPRVVATIASPEAWEKALALAPGDVDLLEVRADLLLHRSSRFPGCLSALPLPAILTVRAPSEGGLGPEDPLARAVLYQRHLPGAAAIDLELAAAPALRDIIADAHQNGIGCLLSFHDFVHTPPLARLQEMTSQARDLGAGLFKVAATTDRASQLNTLTEWLEIEKNLPLAVMGMGLLGKISRPLLAQLGSRLNYGYLDAPLVSGQWPALELRRFLNTLLEERPSGC